MRPSDRPALAPGDHLCRSFSTDAELVELALEHLAEGRRRRERLLYVAGRATAAELLEDLAPLGDVGRLAADGGLLVLPAHAVYTPGGVFDPAGQVAAYERMTAAAVEAGYTGLRVVADATSLVIDPRQRRDFVTYELSVDGLMARVPMTAVCAYDARVLGTALTEVACVHPLRDVQLELEPGFHLSADTGRLTLTGEVDIASREWFELAVDAALAGSGAGGLRIDCGGLRFIDFAGVSTLARAARRSPRLVLQNTTPVVRRAVEALRVGDELRLEAA